MKQQLRSRRIDDGCLAAPTTHGPRSEIRDERHESIDGGMTGRQGIDHHHAGETLSQALRQHARIDEEFVQGVDVNDVVSESLLLMKGKLNGLDVQSVLGELPPVICRRSQIGQVVANLLSNAADAVAEGVESQAGSFVGKVRVETQIAKADVQDGVSIVVSDNGPGISEELRQKIFDSFYTTKEVGKGTGLGLSICGKILAAHGGSIDVSADAELGGALFRCWLPLSPSPQEVSG